MKISLTKDALSGDVPIPRGEYWVSLQSETRTIVLAGQGKDYKIPALRRRAKVNAKTAQVQFYSGGGPTWSIVIVAPKHGEWIASVTYKDLGKR